MNKMLRMLVLTLCVGACLAPYAAAVDDVAGTLHTLTSTTSAPNGAWSWFQDERAIVDAHDPNNVMLLVSSASSAGDGSVESGDVDLLWLNLDNGQRGEFELADRLERDDHDSAALYIRPDGRYLAMYSKHITDQLTRWRVSVDPYDPNAWGPEQTINVGAGTTYNNVHFLPDDNNGSGRTYNFTRATGFDPVVQVSSDNGGTWTTAGQLLTQGGSNDRPYLKYASNGDKIHLISTEEHPRDWANSVYHGYVKNGVLYDSDGTQRDGNIFDSQAISPTLLTPVFKNGTTVGGTTMNRAWTIDLELDNTGNPVGVFSARANDSSSDHRFFYARYDGANWQVAEMARAGGFLYAAENDYTGLVSINPSNPNVVYMSSDIDPRTETSTSNYELYKGTTSDFGLTWSWSAITENSTMDNLRPVVPKWNGKDTVIAWMRGAYTSYTNWNTEVVAMNLAPSGTQALLWRGNTVNPTHWNVNGASNWDSGGVVEVYAEGDEVAFDDSAASFSVDLQTELAPIGVAFNNRLSGYTLTGAGIGGNGRLRVIGGGTVTLANGDNNYTGDTLIAKGTLALSGSAAISGTPDINVMDDGAFDVSARVTGSYTLHNQTLAVAGNVIGDLEADDNSIIQLSASAIHQGNLAALDSLIFGDGAVTGDVFISAGSVLQVGDAGINVPTSLGPTVYVDATSGVSGNTRLSGGGVFTPPLNGVTGADNNWEQRTVLGSSGNIYEAGGEAVENAPTLRTTIGGLSPGGEYQVSVLFWDAVGDPEDWSARAGFGLDSLALFANGVGTDASELGATGAGLASALTYATAPTLFVESNRTLYAGTIGETIANGSGQIDVYIDDRPSTIGANNRTWYDGLGVRQVLSPAELIVLMTIGGDFSQSAGAILDLDIHSPHILDRLDVAGQFNAGGMLYVSLIDGAPEPSRGDVFQILEFSAATGRFDTYELPLLTSGLAWNVSDLLITGELKVVDDVDLDDDGDVDGQDFLIIQSTEPGLIESWGSLYGQHLVPPTAAVSAAVPEPASYLPFYMTLAAGTLMRSPWSLLYLGSNGWRML